MASYAPSDAAQPPIHHRERMFSRDVLLRQIQQFVQVLARVLALKVDRLYDEAREAIDQALNTSLRIDGTTLLALDRDALLALCRDGDTWRGDKAIALADLMSERGRLLIEDETVVDDHEARLWLTQALTLYQAAGDTPGVALPHDLPERIDALRTELAPAPASLADIDWTVWQPVDPATLCFVVQDGEVLLIRKKRGLGAGKINGPGGRLEAGETPHDCAVREVQEELLVTPTDLSPAGELLFQFADGYAIHVHVFRAEGVIGDPEETDEATPLWYPIDDIPYHEMWEDDRIWLPLMLERRRFLGRFLFDNDRMLDWALEEME